MDVNMPRWYLGVWIDICTTSCYGHKDATCCYMHHLGVKWGPKCGEIWTESANMHSWSWVWHVKYALFLAQILFQQGVPLWNSAKCAVLGWFWPPWTEWCTKVVHMWCIWHGAHAGHKVYWFKLGKCIIRCVDHVRVRMWVHIWWICMPGLTSLHNVASMDRIIGRSGGTHFLTLSGTGQLCTMDRMMCIGAQYAHSLDNIWPFELTFEPCPAQDNCAPWTEWCTLVLNMHTLCTVPGGAPSRGPPQSVLI